MISSKFLGSSRFRTERRKKYGISITIIIACIAAAIIVFSFPSFPQACGTSSSMMFSNNVTVHEGDIEIGDVDTFLILNCTFVQKGNIDIGDYATLIVENANLTIEQTEPLQYQISLERNAHVIVRNSTITSNYNLIFYSTGQSHVEVVDSEIRGPSTAEYQGVSNVTITNSTVRRIEGGEYSTISITGSQIDQVAMCCFPTPLIHIFNSTVSEVEATYNSTVNILNSQIGKLFCYDNSTISLLTTKVERMWVLENGVVHVHHRLAVEVTLNGYPIQDADIEIFHTDDATIAASEKADIDGKAQFILAEEHIGSMKKESVGNYTVKVTYENIVKEVKLELTDDGEMEVSLIDYEKPAISEVKWLPEEAFVGQDITISAAVVDGETGISNVTLLYSADNGGTWNTVQMQRRGRNQYRSSIPSQLAGTTVQFFVRSYDKAGNFAETNTFSYSIPKPVPWLKRFWFIPLGLLFMVIIILVIVSRKMKARSKVKKYLYKPTESLVFQFRRGVQTQ